MAETVIISEPFPESPREIYRINPLREVICQLRFPPILRITTEAPAAFQERIRGEYPFLNEKSPEVTVEVPAGVPAAIADMLKANLPNRKLIGYEFVSANAEWKVSLTRDFLSVSTCKYSRWEHFRDHLKGPLQALIAIYGPPFFTRIGLRYQDLIQKSLLHLPASTKWSELIKPHIAGVHALPELEGHIEGSVGQLLIKLPQFGGKVRLNYGMLQAEDTGENCFLIDSDYHTEERTRTDAVDGTLNYFNIQSGRLFRWCIEERLKVALQPQPLDAPA
jgi:uncharacterized protein (TIGR04255 family)